MTSLRSLGMDFGLMEERGKGLGVMEERGERTMLSSHKNSCSGLLHSYGGCGTTHPPTPRLPPTSFSPHCKFIDT